MKKVWLIHFLAALGLFAQSTPRIVYSKSFPGSTPPFVEVALDKTGDCLYKQDPRDDNPLRFRLSAAETAQIFAGAEKLDRFGKPLESGLKVAKLGIKTFRYEGDGAPREVKFNYSENPDAKNLQDWFERIVETEQERIAIERAVRFDKLGVQDAILRIESSRAENRLVAEEQFLPFLDRVAKTESFLHIARERAAALADSIRGAK